MTVGARIKAERTAKGMSRPELAAASGVPYPTLAGLENGDQASSTALPALAGALGLNAKWLQTGKGVKYATPPESQVAGFDTEKLRDSFSLAQLFQELTTGSKDGWDADPRRLVIAYQVVQAESREFTETVLIDLTKKLSAQIKATEKANGDQRRAVEGTGGKDGGSGKRRAGKTAASSG